tara:strand:+ start:39 stop:245 length:207 start_codon:yes stop_codon:yes gene_type:complete
MITPPSNFISLSKKQKKPDKVISSTTGAVVSGGGGGGGKECGQARRESRAFVPFPTPFPLRIENHFMR